MYYYNFHIGDYHTHTNHLTLIEDIAFRRILDFYYLHEAPIKHRTIARQIRMLEYEAEVLSVLNEFFHDTPNGYINPRADEEIAKYRELSNAGKRGAAKRWNNSPPIAPPLPPHSPFNATPIATNNQEPITKNHIYMDFEKVLKAKNKTLTDTLIASIQIEAEKANITLDDAIKTCCARGWTTFKAEWIAPKVDIIHQTVPSKPGRDPTLVKLENDAKNAVAMPKEVKAKFEMIKGRK